MWPASLNSASEPRPEPEQFDDEEARDEDEREAQPPPVGGAGVRASCGSGLPPTPDTSSGHARDPYLPRRYPAVVSAVRHTVPCMPGSETATETTATERRVLDALDEARSSRPSSSSSGCPASPAPPPRRPPARWPGGSRRPARGRPLGARPRRPAGRPGVPRHRGAGSRVTVSWVRPPAMVSRRSSSRVTSTSSRSEISPTGLMHRRSRPGSQRRAARAGRLRHESRCRRQPRRRPGHPAVGGRPERRLRPQRRQRGGRRSRGVRDVAAGSRGRGRRHQRADERAGGHRECRRVDLPARGRGSGRARQHPVEGVWPSRRSSRPRRPPRARGAAQHRRHPLFADTPLPYGISVGTVRSGDWASSVPDLLVAEGRMGFPLEEDPAVARPALEDAVAEAAAVDPWLRDHPPRDLARRAVRSGRLTEGTASSVRSPTRRGRHRPAAPRGRRPVRLRPAALHRRQRHPDAPLRPGRRPVRARPARVGADRGGRRGRQGARAPRRAPLGAH